MNKESLAKVASDIVSSGKGILAADESTPTMGKRLELIGQENTETNRRDFRQALFDTESMEHFISGVILFEISGRTLNSIQINFLKNIIGLIGFIIVLLFTGSLCISYTSHEYWLLGFSALLGVALGDVFLLAGLKRLGSGMYAIAGTTSTLFVFLFAFLMTAPGIKLISN